MITIQDFNPQFISALPETWRLLRSAHLVVADSVYRVVLHGSRGLAGGARPDSDLDLSLLVAPPSGPREEVEAGLREVWQTTHSRWQAPVELDMALVFDIRDCGLPCFEHSGPTAGLCRDGGNDCFGLYKDQKGFRGLVTGAGIQITRMYPCLTLWERPEIAHT